MSLVRCGAATALIMAGTQILISYSLLQTLNKIHASPRRNVSTDLCMQFLPYQMKVRFHEVITQL
jgi:hypothetical protein